MNPRPHFGGRNSRRRFLAAAGAVGASAVAGCTGSSGGGSGGGGDGGGDGGDGGGDSGGDGNGGTGDGTGDGDAGGTCGDVAGTPRPYDVGDRPIVFAFDYPDTWEIYNQGSRHDDLYVDVFLGHSESFTGVSYPMNVYLNQGVAPLEASVIEEWMTPAFTDHEVTATVDFGGEQVDVAYAQLDERGWNWRFGIPAAGGYRRVEMISAVGSDYATCSESVVGVATALIESIRPNPDYSG